ncbi:hypothetical protein ACQ33O_06895 [Ferruginibacter sp. SUN002]|uniref:hypothetical protein n=1 Tax=Ferruginibacter sp. SUN002 TaxID=2937789 RepID=UPI003D35EDB1
MNDFEKYSRLMILLIGGILGGLLLIIGVFYTLKLFAITLFNIPGFESFFGIMVTIIPYLIFFAGYRYMYKKILLSKGKISKLIAQILMVIGTLLCLSSLVMLSLHFFGVKNEWLALLDEKSYWAIIAQILLLFFTAMATASGDEKEKDWMERS